MPPLPPALVVADEPAPVAPRAAQWPATEWQDWPSRKGLLPLAMVALVLVAPAIGVDPTSGRGGRLVLAALAVLVVIAALIGQYPTARLGAAFTATLAAFALPWQIAWWPLPGLVGIGVYLAGGALPALCASHPAIWRLGRLGRIELAAIAGIAGLSATVLLAYHALTPRTLEFGAALIKQLPVWCLPLAGIIFATGNAAIEEYLFRGVIFTHLARAVGTWPAVAVQAVGFGLLHLNGYPNGPVGAALAAGYGLLLGVLRHRTGGLLACWITHTLTDGLIFAFIVHAAVHAL
jgi:membrane protease YdiL (CAAX protease family)